VNSLIKVNKIEVTYGDVIALFDVSMDIYEGEITAVIGSNGAGKSTLLKTLTGLLKPRRGTIELNGTRIDHLKPEEIVKLGISLVPEGRKLFPRLTVTQNMILGAFTINDKSKVEEGIEYVYNIFPRLKERHNQLAGTLSGGEQQMAAIARGLMANPKVLMIDEMSLGLAPIIVTELFELILNISNHGLTVLLVEQNVAEALSIANRAYVMQTGKIVLEGETKEIMKSDIVKKAYLGM
jgi:branched-chain amino acid transport system ATP-binding protein